VTVRSAAAHGRVTEWDRRLLDPFTPIMNRGRPAGHAGQECRQQQKLRRSEILAAIRRLLAESGFENITMRRIAERSGYSIQTTYNLIGPREIAVIEAISEYSLFVGRVSSPQADDPAAIIEIVHRWIQSIYAVPEFCQQVSKIFFSDSRNVYYEFRDRQLRGMKSLLRRQQEHGIVRKNVKISEVAEDISLFASALLIEWSDRPFPVERLHDRLRSGCSGLLSDNVDAQYRPALLKWQAAAAN